MQVTINHEPQEAQVSLRQGDKLGEELLYVNDMCVTRVTHSLSDDIPVILQIDRDVQVEVGPQSFYAIQGMRHDWQPGVQADSLGAA